MEFYNPLDSSNRDQFYRGKSHYDPEGYFSENDDAIAKKELIREIKENVKKNAKPEEIQCQTAILDLIQMINCSYTSIQSKYIEMKKFSGLEEESSLHPLSCRATSCFYHFLLDGAAERRKELVSKLEDVRGSLVTWWGPTPESIEKEIKQLDAITSNVLVGYTKHLKDRENKKIYFPSLDPFFSTDYGTDLYRDSLEKLSVYHEMLMHIAQQIENKGQDSISSEKGVRNFVHFRADQEKLYLQSAFNHALECYDAYLKEEAETYEKNINFEFFIPKSVREVSVIKEASAIIHFENHNTYYQENKVMFFEENEIHFGKQDASFKQLRKKYISILLSLESYASSHKENVNIHNMMNKEIDYMRRALSHMLKNYLNSLIEYYVPEKSAKKVSVYKDILAEISQEIELRTDLRKDQRYQMIQYLLDEEKNVLQQHYKAIEKEFTTKINPKDIFIDVINQQSFFAPFVGPNIEAREVNALTIEDCQEWLKKIPEAIQQKQVEQKSKGNGKDCELIEIEINALKTLFVQVLEKYDRYLKQRIVPQKFYLTLNISENGIHGFDGIAIQPHISPDQVAAQRDVYLEFLDIQNRYQNRYRETTDSKWEQQVLEIELDYLEREVAFQYKEYLAIVRNVYLSEKASGEDYNALCDVIEEKRTLIENKHKDHEFLRDEVEFLETLRKELKEMIFENHHKNPLALLITPSWSTWFFHLFGFPDPFLSELNILEKYPEDETLAARYNYILSRTIHVMRRKVIESKKVQEDKKEILNSEIRALEKFFDSTIAEYENLYNSDKITENMQNFMKRKAAEVITGGFYQGGFETPQGFKKQKAFAACGYDMIDRLTSWFGNTNINNSDQKTIVSAIHEKIEKAVKTTFIEDREGKKIEKQKFSLGFLKWAVNHPHSAAIMVSDLKIIWGILNHKDKFEILEESLRDIYLTVEFLQKANPKITSIELEPVETEEELDFRMLADLCHVLPKIFGGIKGAWNEIMLPNESNPPLLDGAISVVKTFVPAVGIFEAALKVYPAISQSARIFGAILVEVAKISAIQKAQELHREDLLLAHAVVAFMNEGEVAFAASKVLKLQRDAILARQAGSIAHSVIACIDGKSLMEQFKEWCHVFWEAPRLEKGKILFFNVFAPILLTICSTHVSFIMSTTLPMSISLVLVGAAIFTAFFIAQSIFSWLAKDTTIQQVRKKIRNNEIEKEIKNKLEIAKQSKEFQLIAESYANSAVVLLCEHFNSLVNNNPIEKSYEIEQFNSHIENALNVIEKNQWKKGECTFKTPHFSDLFVEKIVEELETNIKNESSDEDLFNKFFTIVKKHLDLHPIYAEIQKKIFGTLATVWLLPLLRIRSEKTFTEHFEEKFVEMNLEDLIKDKDKPDIDEKELNEQISKTVVDKFIQQKNLKMEINRRQIESLLKVKV